MARLFPSLPRVQVIGTDDAPVIDPRDAPFLEAAELLTPVDSRGFRKIHKRRLREGSNREYFYMSYKGSKAITEELLLETIPENRVSQAALEYMGYDAETAAIIWRRWLYWMEKSQTCQGSLIDIDEDDSIQFIECAAWHIHFFLETTELNHEGKDDDGIWNDCFDICGIGQKLRDESMLLCDFQKHGGAEACLEWLKKKIFGRYQDLGRIQEESRGRVLEREKNRRTIEQEANGFFSLNGNEYHWWCEDDVLRVGQLWRRMFLGLGTIF
ncbi:hypothetical protein CDD82_713 [Ophiocordyceps australis]|uniref:Uncharacterized protein n=1 Tax=Ophiocordyceps australis TaxID=1399860 RepID=A0A2C5XDB2_9HYPO|nr:hypothetical protein CDD82_713 [Ophiocordyceps australis]